MDNLLELFGKDVFARNCGIRIEDMQPGSAVCVMDATEAHLNGLGIVMGGAVFTLADFAFSVAANSYGVPAVSLNAQISYLRASLLGALKAIATEVGRSNRTGVYRVRVENAAGETVADFTGTCFFKK